MIDITRSPVIAVLSWNNKHLTKCPGCGKEEERHLGDWVEGFADAETDRLWVYCNACEYALAMDR
jgi:hypothetical protein